jgi:hypothetical protein
MLSSVLFTCRAIAGRPAACLAALAVAVGAGAAAAADRGACLSMKSTASRTASEIDQMVAGFGVEAQLYSAATCGVELYHIRYATVAPDGSPAVASAGMVVPAQCTGPFPLVEYNHGTWTTIQLAMSDPGMSTVQEVMAQFGGQGYAAVMPDYLGYDASTLAWHPYLHAASSADVTMDAVRAARNCLAGSQQLDGTLFLTGTSEGGYVTMATHEAMEALGTDEFTIAASVSTSGPYALSDSTMQTLKGNNGTPGYAWMQLQSYQHIYGDVYGKASEVFQLPYVGEPEFPTLLPNAKSLDRLTRSGRLAPMLEGPAGLLTTAFIGRYMNNPDEPARIHVLANDLRNFAPVAPMAACYGDPDSEATFNAKAVATYFQSRGVSITLADIEDVEQYRNFIQHMAGKNYHSLVEAPACIAWARQFEFDPIRRAARR